MSIDFEESARDYVERMIKEGYEVCYPKDNELFLDIDKVEQLSIFIDQYAVLKNNIPDVTFAITPSKSGKQERRHIRVTMPFDTHIVEKIAYQALLGSDPMKEMLSLINWHEGVKQPIILVEVKK